MNRLFVKEDSKCLWLKLKQAVIVIVITILILAVIQVLSEKRSGSVIKNYVKGRFLELNDNGAWSWFMDERAIVDSGWLIVGSVRANGTFHDQDQPGWGNVELAVLNLQSYKKYVVVLHEKLEQDDHNSPSLLVLPDGRYLVIYSKHSQEPRIYYRFSKEPHNPFEWGPVINYNTPGKKEVPWGGDNVTYTNPVRLARENGRTYLFHRGVGQDPNYLVSNDDGHTWAYGGKLYVGLDGYSPYTKYASNSLDTIHFIATEDHPRKFDNSLYHGFVLDSKIHQSDGTVIAPLAMGSKTTVNVVDLTRIYQGGPNNVAWLTDVQLDTEGHPVVLFTVQVDSAGLPKGQGGVDHRFHYAHWDGSCWHQSEIAYAGKRLYAGEEDYTGLGAIDPQNTNVLYISTDADPITGKPLISKADNLCHHEIFRGITSDGGKTWKWTNVTANSTVDNLRPLVPFWSDQRTILIWMRGVYKTNRGEWTTKVVATLLQ